MAKVLKEHEFPRPNRKARHQEYPWDKWLDGKIRKLTRGEDFFATVTSFRTVTYRAAAVRGVRVVTDRIDDNTIVIQAFDDLEED